MLCGTQYSYRHEQVAKYLHWNILRDMKINVSKSWLKHQPPESTFKNGVALMWDMKMATDKKVKYNYPDIVIHYKNKKECLFIDMTIPNCINVVSKEAEKITRYHDLEVEVQQC